MKQMFVEMKQMFVLSLIPLSWISFQKAIVNHNKQFQMDFASNKTKNIGSPKSIVLGEQGVSHYFYL